MTNTTNYGLRKPEANDYVNVEDLNYNADAIDAALHDLSTGKEDAGAAEKAVSAHDKDDRSHTDIRAALSNKQDLIWLGIAESDADLNDLKQIGTTAIHGTSKNVPPDVRPESWGLLTVNANSKYGQVGCTQHLSIMVSEGYIPQAYERNWNGLNWSNWARIATATSPQEFDIPLAEGLSAVNPCTYRKNQFGEVSFGGAASGTIEVGTAIATLPSGVRPIKTVERPAVYSVDGAWTGGTVVITTDGIVRAYGQTSATSVAFAVDFVAAD